MDMGGGTCMTTQNYEPELKEKYGNPEPPSSGVLLTTQVFNPFDPNFKYNRRSSREKEHSENEPLPNDLQDLLVSSAVKDASHFECLNGKEVEEIKKKIKVIRGNLDMSVKKLAVEAKIREAAKNLMLAQTKEKKGKHKQSTVEHYEQCSRKVRELSSKIWVVERKLSELYFFLLKHMVAVCIREIRKQPKNSEQQSDPNVVSQKSENDEKKLEEEEEEVMNHEEIQQLVERMEWMLETVHSMGSSVHEPSVVNVVDMTAGEKLLEQIRHLEILLKGMREKKLEEEADAKDIAPRSILNFWKALNRLFQQEIEQRDLQLDSSYDLEQVQMHLKPNFDIESFAVLLNSLLTKYQRVKQLHTTNQDLLDITKRDNVKKLGELGKVVDAQNEQVEFLQMELEKVGHTSEDLSKENIVPGSVPESNGTNGVLKEDNKQIPPFEVIKNLHSQCSLLYGEKYEIQQNSLLLESRITELENEKKANKLLEKDLLAQISQLRLDYEQQKESNEFTKKLINNLRDERTAMQAELSVVKAMNTQAGASKEPFEGETQKHLDVLTKENELLHSRVNTLELEKEHQERNRDTVNTLTLKQLQVEELFANLDSDKKMDFGLIDFRSPQSDAGKEKDVHDVDTGFISASDFPDKEEKNEHNKLDPLNEETENRAFINQQLPSNKDVHEEEINPPSASEKYLESETATNAE
ncbi:septation protein Uds1 [Schizosaccharomyces osmophilus]|uniref:Septation protein Uds1 n=1 Tax=Schizosaccharomyces osmophilus TaxID=2545709 RepID=A0AAE9W6F0_9SCHI|nr:septation protein Uds1 [Schizosaccharomyces osmophilus]WBW70890.1 septation protein Uds1 [Schizosaccharomyces osmophilus]